MADLSIGADNTEIRQGLEAQTSFWHRYLVNRQRNYSQQPMADMVAATGKTGGLVNPGLKRQSMHGGSILYAPRHLRVCTCINVVSVLPPPLLSKEVTFDDDWITNDGCHHRQESAKRKSTVPKGMCNVHSWNGTMVREFVAIENPCTGVGTVALGRI
jgi:hypothetical protein